MMYYIKPYFKVLAAGGEVFNKEKKCSQLLLSRIPYMEIAPIGYSNKDIYGDREDNQVEPCCAV